MCRGVLHLVGVVSGVGGWVDQGTLTGPIFQQVEGDVSSQQYPLQSEEEERRESPKQGSSNKGTCV